MIMKNPNNKLEQETIIRNRNANNLWYKNFEFWESLKIIKKDISVKEEQQLSTTTSGIAA